MSKTTIEAQVEQYNEYIKGYGEAIENLKELLSALEQWTFKNVDKRFNKQFFTVERENWTYCKYELATPSYSYERFAYSIYINNYCKLELLSRETAHIKEEVRKEIDKLTKWTVEYEQKIKTLSVVDEKAIIEDLRAVFFKHGSPETWNKMLELYEVRYPKN